MIRMMAAATALLMLAACQVATAPTAEADKPDGDGIYIWING